MGMEPGLGVISIKQFLQDIAISQLQTKVEDITKRKYQTEEW